MINSNMSVSRRDFTISDTVRDRSAPCAPSHVKVARFAWLVPVSSLQEMGRQALGAPGPVRPAVTTAIPFFFASRTCWGCLLAPVGPLSIVMV